jgi:phage terminase large subunit GpA-like protein
MSVDVQDNRLAVKIKAYGVNNESWLVYWTEIYGDPAGDDLWNQIDNLLDRDYPHACGKTMRITATAVDSGGHHTQRVYAFARDRREKNVIAIKGSNTPNQPVRGKPTEQDIDHRGKKIKKGVKLWHVGTDTAKAIIYARARVSEGQGRMHFYAGLDPSYFQQLTSEVRVPRYDHGRQVGYLWMVPKKGTRNEALDCEVYCLAAAYHAGIERVDWARLQKIFSSGNIDVQQDSFSPTSEDAELAAKGQQEPSEPKPVIDRDLQRRRAANAGGRRGGWMNGWR